MKDVGKVKRLSRVNSFLSGIKEIPERGVSTQTKLLMLGFYLFGHVFHKCSKIETKEYMFS